MKYGLRAILWAHKLIKGKITYGDIPEDRLTRVDRYLEDHGHEDLIPSDEPLDLEPEVG